MTDLLRWRPVARFARWRHGRTVMQGTLLAGAVAIVLHGLLGSPIGPRNLATVLTAIHWRGLLVVALLAVGNLFCAACPMMLVRDWGRRVVAPVRRWPRVLRRKWIAIALFAAVLFSYELFDMWSLPAATAWIVLAYFAAALCVDLTCTGASFCKYVCPIGQFNFLGSTVSPTELQVRDIATCRSCRTSDCIRGRRAPVEPSRITRRGCELGLFLPMKVGNLDCTFCFDCVRACPHDNIALTTRTPAAEWIDTSHRSGIGRLTRRADLAALAVVFTAAAPLNALVMTAPGHVLEQRVMDALGGQPEALALALLFVCGLVLLPAVVLLPAAAVTRAVTRSRRSLRNLAIMFAYAFVPYGFGEWLAHYTYHLFTGALTIVPVTQSAVIDASGRALLGEPLWGLTGLRPGSMIPIEAGFVLLGAAGSLALIHATADREWPGKAVVAASPWIVVLVLLLVASLWLIGQPMDMRGLSAFR